jgi:ribosomal protein L3
VPTFHVGGGGCGGCVKGWGTEGRLATASSKQYKRKAGCKGRIEVDAQVKARKVGDVMRPAGCYMVWFRVHN